MNPTPPRWAEALLALSLRRDDVGSVSGDLLEEYRDRILPMSGRQRADWWYLTQVFGFLWRSAFVWALFFGGAFLVRTALDWLMPPASFQARAAISTMIAAGILLVAGWWAAWRSHSLVAGTVAGLMTAAIGALVSVAGAAALLAVRHDTTTMAAIHASGGLTEVFVLPFVIVVPAALVATFGGAAGVALRRLFAA